MGLIVKGFDPNQVMRDPEPVLRALRKYSELLHPWARSVANLMLADVERRDLRMWKDRSLEISRYMRAELEQAPTGQVYRDLMEGQVELITSLPLDAATRVHELAQEAMLTGQRSATIKEEILRTSNVSESKARLIARTEVARSAASFMEARATFAGSEGYIWRTSKDSDVRPLHKEMEGEYVRWSHPPKLEKTLDPYHAGCGPNCRCYAEPVLPDL